MVGGILVLGACGRIGYDARGGGSADAGDDADAGDSTDAAGASDAGLPWTALACGQPAKILSIGASSSPPPASFAVDATANATGFVVMWAAGDGRVHGAGFALDGAGQIAVLQGNAVLATTSSLAFASAAIGDVTLAGFVVENGQGEIELLSLTPAAEPRGAREVIIGYLGRGHGFVAADPALGQFVVMGATSSGVRALPRDLDGRQVTQAKDAFTVPTRGAAATAIASGYGMLNAQTVPDHCMFSPMDRNGVALAPPHEIQMTCNNASIVRAPGADKVLAAWNCTNDAVWVSAGDPAKPLSSPRAVFQGNAVASASDPRIAPRTSDLWYAYRIDDTHLGRAIVDRDGNEVLAPAEVYQSVSLRAYDLISHGDDGYLVWLESDSRDEMWAMRLCAP